jgi:hypothetical protein
MQTVWREGKCRIAMIDEYLFWLYFGKMKVATFTDLDSAIDYAEEEFLE